MLPRVTSKAEVGLSDMSMVDFGCMGTLEDRNFMSSAGVPQKKRKRSQTERICGDAGPRVLPGHGGGRQQELGWSWISSPSAVGETRRVKLVRQEVRRKWVCTQLNLCKDCNDCRLIESAESKVSNAVCYDMMIKRKTSRGRLWAAFSSDVSSKERGSDLPSKRCGQSIC